LSLLLEHGDRGRNVVASRPRRSCSHEARYSWAGPLSRDRARRPKTTTKNPNHGPAARGREPGRRSAMSMAPQCQADARGH
jgi:hypothetical protein